MATLQIRDVPDELRRQVRMLCLRENTSMNKKVIDLIRRWVEEQAKDLPKGWLNKP